MKGNVKGGGMPTEKKPEGMRYLAVLSCALWGLAFPAIKIGYRLFGIAADDTGAVMCFAGARFFLAGILAWAIGSVLYRRPLMPKRSSAGKILILALLQTFLQYFFFYVGLAHTTGVKASIINATNVFVSLFVAGVIFHQETLSVRKWLGCAIGFLGAVLVNVNGGGLSTSVSFTGEGFLFLSTVAYAFSSACIKKFSEDELPFTLSSYQFMVGGVLLFLVGLLVRIISGRNVAASAGTGVSGNVLFHVTDHAAAIGILLLLAMISAVAYSLWGELLKRFPVSKVTVFGFLTPVFGVIFSALLLNEGEGQSPVRIAVALLLVVTGTVLVHKE